MITLKLPKDIKHIIFDFDGTLVDSAPGIISCLSSILNNNNITPKCELSSDLVGPPLEELIKSCSDIKDYNIIADLSDKFKELYDSEGYKDTIAFNGVYDMLTKLSNDNFKLYIATNKRSIPTINIINFLKWDNLFDGIYAIDSFLPKSYSKSEIISKVISNHCLDINSIVYIGDLEVDRIAAETCSVKFIMAEWGYNSDHVFGHNSVLHPEQLYRTIKNLLH
jgi:phosphoglycolate phosphatase